MKITTAALSALSLLSLATAQPHRVRHAHQEKHAKKDAKVVVFTVIDTVYADPTDSPKVVVYVNQFGVPISTTTEGLETTPTLWSTRHGVLEAQSAPATSEPAAPATSAPPAPVVQVAPVLNIISSSSAPAPVETIAPAPAPAPVETIAPVPVESIAAAPVASSPEPVASSYPAETSSAPSSSSYEASGYGFSYSPYMADNSCKTQEQVNADFAKIGDGYSLVRTYGVDCNQTATVLTAAKAHKLKLFAGIFSLDSLSNQVDIIAEAANGDWSSFDTISVGNELVNSGTASPAAVVAAIGTVRGLLKNAGYTGKVVTVDTLVATRANPTLCDNSDYCAVNCHPFFDGNVAAKGAGDFLTTQIPTLRNVLANKDQEIVITETGWPWKGEPNGAAVPSPGNQADALSSIKSTFSSNPSGVILFTSFNDLWKTNTAAQFQAEQYWGFLGDAPSG